MTQRSKKRISGSEDTYTLRGEGLKECFLNILFTPLPLSIKVVDDTDFQPLLCIVEGSF